ncbi:hypothetical protein MWU75_03855 [Ornithinimicrobium sp. F0845]|uniref:hypothetical protein n=1 Tax=Ornithinimicrobium sp. F0845 TaxID=2926412 RepID=UPI001FF100F2|nr:hypothetical protein [Ornithinimicrobium sp. F0845]MCK0111273.1 hypothetical protein [Ornithinimicrobium sp. F0845]
MSTFEVDPRALDTAATTFRSTAEELRHLAHQVGGALHLAGSAAGSAALESSGAAAARMWSGGLEQYAEAGAALSRATEQAALLYDLVEFSARGRFIPVVHP